MNRYGAMAAVLTAAAAASLVMPITAEASGNMELRRRVIQLSGILNNGMAGTYATRGEFACRLPAPMPPPSGRRRSRDG